MHAAVVVREALYRQVNDMYLSARKEQRKEKGTAPQGKKKKAKGTASISLSSAKFHTGRISMLVPPSLCV